MYKSIHNKHSKHSMAGREYDKEKFCQWPVRGGDRGIVEMLLGFCCTRAAVHDMPSIVHNAWAKLCMTSTSSSVYCALCKICMFVAHNTFNI